MLDRWHVSYGLKHPGLFNNEFIAAHGYTLGEWQPFLTDSSQDLPKLDSTVNTRGNPVWPRDAVRLPRYLYPADVRGLRSRFIRRARVKFGVGGDAFWSFGDEDDVSAQLFAC